MGGDRKIGAASAVMQTIPVCCREESVVCWSVFLPSTMVMNCGTSCGRHWFLVTIGLLQMPLVAGHAEVVVLPSVGMVREMFSLQVTQEDGESPRRLQYS